MDIAAELWNELDGLIDEVGLSHRKDLIRALALPSVRLIAEKADDSTLPLGPSKIGGRPDLPAGIAWPRSGDGETQYFYGDKPQESLPLAFVAQINFAEAAPFDTLGLLPTVGMLYLFVSEDGYGCGWRVLFIDVYTALERQDFPATLHEEQRYHAHQLRARSELTLPTHRFNYSFDGSDEDDEENLENFYDVFRLEWQHPGLTKTEWEAYGKLFTLLEGDGGKGHHQMLGHPYYIQNPKKLELEMLRQGIKGTEQVYETLRDWNDPFTQKLWAQAETSQWQLLLQIDSIQEGDAPMIWGDVGILYLFLHGTALESRNFDLVVFEEQCG